MTRKEARIRLIAKREELMHKYMVKEAEVLTMAIKALQADTVEVVRCKDCKFSESVITSWSTGGKNNAVERLCKVHKWSVKDNDFCSYGERREK